MANEFVPARAKDIGTSFVDIYEAPVGKTSFLGELDVCNTTNAGVTCDVVVESSAVDYYVVKNAPVPIGSTLAVVTEQRIVLSPGDKIKVLSSAPTSLDVNAAIMEDVNS